MNRPPAALAARFQQRMAHDLAAMRGGQPSGPAFELMVHQLTGMAGMYGFAEVGRMAAIVDAQIVEGAVRQDDLAALVTALETALRRD